MGATLSAVVCGLATPALAKMSCAAVVNSPRLLSLHNLHTNEKIRTVYWKDGSYDRAGWAEINHILRDHYSGDAHIIDLRLLDLLHEVQSILDNHGPIEIISGYRSPATNRRLSEASGGVAKNSFHMRGMAVDIRMASVPLPRLHQTALEMQRGGVGYYPKSEFVHIDVGPVRQWGSI
jgi:uncharacterized protein YcbK (DUF882 family)